jgi:fluoride exporter
VPLLLVVCLGGAVGSGARYLVQTAAIRSFGVDFPHGTLAVNLVGSLLIGVVQHLGLSALAISDTTRIALVTGVLGGFTTYSAFSYEAVTLMVEGAWGRGILYISLTTVGCLLACALGLALGRALVAPR